jgi:OmpA-OmpF porin, OOP family
MTGNRKINRCLIATLASLGIAGSAHANGLYFGLSGGIGNTDLSKSDFDKTYIGTPIPAGYKSSLDNSTTTWGAQVGYDFNDYVGLEVGYVDLGTAQYDATYQNESVRNRFESSGLTLAVTGTFPFSGQFDVHGRAGVLFSDTRSTEKFKDLLTGDTQGDGTKGTDNDFFLGVGAGWNINHTFTLRLDYTHFMKVGTEDETGEANIDMVTIGFLFR